MTRVFNGGHRETLISYPFFVYVSHHCSVVSDTRSTCPLHKGSNSFKGKMTHISTRKLIYSLPSGIDQAPFAVQTPKCVSLFDASVKN